MASNDTALCESGWRDRDSIIHFEHDCAVPVLAQDTINWISRALSLTTIAVFAANVVLIIWRGAAMKRQKDLGLCIVFLATGFEGFCFTLDDLFFYPGLFIAFIICEVMFAFGIVPFFFFSEVIQDTFECLLALDPRARENVYSTIRRAILPIVCAAATMTVGSLGCYFAEGRNVYYGVTAWCIGLGVWCTTAAFLLFKTALRLRQIPPSARAYLDEYPKQARAIQKLQAVCLLLGTSILVAAAVSLLTPIFFRRWFGIAMAVFVGTSLPGAIILGGYIFQESWRRLYIESNQPHRISPSRRLTSRHTKIEPSKSSVSPLKERTSKGSCFPLKSSIALDLQLEQAWLARCEASTIRGLLQSIPASTQIRGAMRGLSIEFLDIFYKEFDISERETTYEVCQRVIIPLTKLHQCTFSDLLSEALKFASNRAMPVPTNKDIWQGEHTVFVSHTWGKPFWHLIQTAKQFVQNHPSREKDFFYLDILALNQHQLADEKRKSVKLGIGSPSKPDVMLPETAISCEASIPTESLVLRSLNKNIRSVTTMLVAINKWDDPAPLSRIWCLYEVWQAVRHKIPLVMGFSGKEAERFCQAVESLEMDLDETIPALVDISKAQATVESDLIMIKSAINDGIGMDALNGILRQKLMAHLVRSHVQLSRNVSEATRRSRRQSLWPR